MLILDLIVIGFLSFRGIKTFSSTSSSSSKSTQMTSHFRDNGAILNFMRAAAYVLQASGWQSLLHQSLLLVKTRAWWCKKKRKKIREILWNYSWILVILVPSLIVAIFFGTLITKCRPYYCIIIITLLSYFEGILWWRI